MIQHIALVKGALSRHIVGPYPNRLFSHKEGHHFITHSRKLWVLTLKTKDQVFDVFKEFHVFMEREIIGKKLKCIHIDTGGEHCGSFAAYYPKH